MKQAKIRNEIESLIRRRPRTKTEIIAAVWQLHPQDAPRPSAIKAHVWHINQRLSGERITAERGHHIETPYRLVRV